MAKQIVIGIVGETGSGKDTVWKYAEEKYGAVPLRFSSSLKKILSMFFANPAKDDQMWLFGVLQERFGKDILHKAIRKQIEDSEADFFCVNGLRMPQDEEFIRSFPNSVIVYVTAPQKLRWERTVDRGEKSDDQQPFEDFQKFETTPTEVNVPKIGENADYRIDNTGTLDDLLASFDEIMKNFSD